jgi:dihydropteroate synthase/2-amino-4-hydroxy-6-hydroxymethyldihydropteridine diphosphokinase
MVVTLTNLLTLGLGTNLGNRRANLRQAVIALEETGLVSNVALSPVYETAPWGVIDQPDFLNICLQGSTALAPEPLLYAIKDLENQLGRRPAERYGPRLIDIDILAHGDQVIDQGRLKVPHPGLPERLFVLAPLADLAAEWAHPVTGDTVVEMLHRHAYAGVRRLPLPLFWGRRTLVMGILNITPDSFSGDGLLAQEAEINTAVDQAVRFANDGADFIDIGGESTRPGSTPVTAAEEMARILPVISAVRRAVRVPISVDTFRAETAQAALAAGADLVNDVWGLRMDPEMAGVVAAAGCPVIVMHNRSRPKNVAQETQLGGRYVGIEYDDLLVDIGRELQESVDRALAAGVDPANIIIDPGIGFGKTVSQNCRLLRELDTLRDLGYPILIGPSRKSFIGYTLNLPPHDRVEGTAATVAIGIDRGADIVRVHDVTTMVRVARMTDRIVR